LDKDIIFVSGLESVLIEITGELSALKFVFDGMFVDLIDEYCLVDLVFLDNLLKLK